MGGAAVPPERPPDQRTFSKEELQQILQERNELKTSLFLVEEELAYYQRSVSLPGYEVGEGGGASLLMDALQPHNCLCSRTAGLILAGRPKLVF